MRFGLVSRVWRMRGLLFGDRKSTRLNSSHSQISYAVFCLKKKKHDPVLDLCLSVRAALQSYSACGSRHIRVPCAQTARPRCAWSTRTLEDIAHDSASARL